MKNLFRSWTTLSIIVIGPLTLLFALLIGFSDTGFHHIEIGIVSEQSGVLNTPFVRSLENTARFRYYETTEWERCIIDVQQQDLHLCIEVRGSHVDAFYDPARERVSLMLLSEIRNAVEKHKEDLLRTQTQNFLSDVGNTASLLDKSDEFAGRLQGDLDDAEDDLQLALQDVQQAQTDIDGYIVTLRQRRQKVQRASTELDRISRLDIATARNSLDDLDWQLRGMQTIAQNQQNWVAYDAISDARADLTETRNALFRAETELSSASREVKNVLIEIDNAIVGLQNAKTKLYNAELKIRNAIDTIDDRQKELRYLRQDVQNEKSRLGGIQNTDVNQLVRPIELKVQQIVYEKERVWQWKGDLAEDRADATSIQVWKRFGSTESLIPTILALLVSFIAVILSNIVLLEEIHSKAFLRNTLIPGSRFAYISSILFTTVTVTFIEMCFFLLASVFAFNLRGFGLSSIIAIFLMVLIYSVIGLLIGFVVKNKTTSLLTCVFLLLISILLGGVLFPIERMASYMPFITILIPMTPGISVIQQELFHSVGFWSFWLHFIILGFYSMIALSTLAITAAIMKWRD